jgi:hypothetical protein
MSATSHDAPSIKKSISRATGLRMTSARVPSSSGTHGSSSADHHGSASGSGNGHGANGHNGRSNGAANTLSMRSSSIASSTHESSTATDHGPAAGDIYTNGAGRVHMMNQFAENNPPVRTATNSSSQSGSMQSKSRSGRHKLNPTRTDYINAQGVMIRPSEYEGKQPYPARNQSSMSASDKASNTRSAKGGDETLGEMPRLRTIRKC